MRILTTFPGKFGDILWALPSVRALAEATGASVDLAVAAESASICPLLEAQPYIGKAFALADWIGLAEPHMPWQAPKVEEYDAQVDLGYRGWPDCPLPFYTFNRLRTEACWAGVKESALELGRPWLCLPLTLPVEGMDVADLSIGFSDEHFELKLGITALVTEAAHVSTRGAIAAPGSRWATEGHQRAATWIEAARYIRTSRVFLGCCSALHVLACGLDVPVVLMEPSEARWNGIFYPLGTTDRVTLVLGNDGLPTFDARAVAEAVRQGLEATR